MTEGALAGLRVVEICDEIGAYCGKLLADLGAEVIKIEPPGGARQRRTPPFFHGLESPDASLAFWAHNTSKKSVVLDLESEAGRTAAAQLIATADAVLEDQPVGALAARGLTYERFRAARPALVWTSVTGFGQTGPHAGFAYDDLIGQAMGGLVTLAGFPERPPHQIYGHQADVSASIHAAQGTLAALLLAEETGEGQTVDVSAQEAVSMSQETAMQTWDLQRRNRVRTGGLVGRVNVVFPGYGLYACRDGHVFLMITQSGGLGFPRLVSWMRERGMEEDLDESPYREVADALSLEWLTQVSMQPEGPLEIQPQLDHMQAVTQRFLASMGAEEAFEESQRRQFFVGLVSTPEQLARNPQLRARDWFVRFEGPDGSETEFPGPPYRLSLTPAQVRRPPWLGEHTTEVLASLGLPASSPTGASR